MIKYKRWLPVEDIDGNTQLGCIELLVFSTGTVVSLVLSQTDVDLLKSMSILVEIDNGRLDDSV